MGKVVTYFFVLLDLAHIRHMYQFSLRWFLSVFQDALASCPKASGACYFNSTHMHSLFVLPALVPVGVPGRARILPQGVKCVLF